MENCDVRIFDEEEIYENCTVQIWSNSVTGKVSIGWWHGNMEDMPDIKTSKDL
jgi:hypothetical protein